MTTIRNYPPRNPRLGEAVFIWTGQRLEAGRIVGIYAAQPFNLERFHIYLIDQARMLACGRGDFALLPELRQLIPRMGRAPGAIDHGTHAALQVMVSSS